MQTLNCCLHLGHGSKTFETVRRPGDICLESTFPCPDPRGSYPVVTRNPEKLYLDEYSRSPIPTHRPGSWGWHEARLVECCLVWVQIGLDPQECFKADMEMQAYGSNTGKVAVKRSEVQSHLWLCSSPARAT